MHQTGTASNDFFCGWTESRVNLSKFIVQQALSLVYFTSHSGSKHCQWHHRWVCIARSAQWRDLTADRHRRQTICRFCVKRYAWFPRHKSSSSRISTSSFSALSRVIRLSIYEKSPLLNENLCETKTPTSASDFASQISFAPHSTRYIFISFSIVFSPYFLH